MKLEINIEIVDSFPDNDYGIARVFYHNEGNTIFVKKGLSKAFLEKTLFHEVSHVVDWYMSEGSQSKDVDRRESIAISVGNRLYKLFISDKKENRESE